MRWTPTRPLLATLATALLALTIAPGTCLADETDGAPADEGAATGD